MVLLINSRFWKRGNRVCLYLWSETVILITHRHCCWSSLPLPKSFHFTPVLWSDQSLHRCQAKLPSILRYTAWFLEDMSKRSWGSLPDLCWWRLIRIPSATPGEDDLTTSHSLPCVVADFCRRWFGLFQSRAPEQATGCAKTLELKESGNKAGGAITSTLDYPIRWDLALVATLQPPGRRIRQSCFYWQE